MGEPVRPQALIKAAEEARISAYAPYSQFSVGAALLTESGRIFRGCNVENISFGLTICAERSAVVSAVQAREQKFSAIAISAATQLPIVPCGACRQFLAEFNPNLTIWSTNASGTSTQWNLAELLPHPLQGILNAVVPHGT